MARENQKTADSRRTPEPDRRDRGPSAHSGNDWYGGERENEFGGEGRFRADGGHGAHGSHFGGEPEALRDDEPDPSAGQDGNKNAWRGERRKKFVEKFDRWRSERAARAAHGGPGNAPSESAPAARRSGKK